MDKNNIKKFNELDSELGSLSKQLRLVHHLQPVNEIEQKKEFFKHNTEPSFLYIEPGYDTQNFHNSLNEIEVPEGIMTPYYKKYLKNLELYNKMVETRGTSEFLKISVQVENKPDKALLTKAEEILRDEKVEEESKELPASEIKKHFEDYFNQYKIRWTVEYHSKYGVFLDRPRRTLYLNKERMFGKSEAARLLVHEVETHIYRGINGSLQPWKLFAKGLPGYMMTEEGLATYNEEVTGNSNPGVLRSYAGRVVSVDSVLNNLSFREAFARLKDFDIENGMAWDLTLRAYRGGGFTKDYVYLDGYFKVKDYIEKGGDAKILYVGKIGLHHLDMVERLLNEGILQPPKYLPNFLDTSSK